MSGLQRRHCDSGRPCSGHQSPVALKAGMSVALQRVHMDSGTLCSGHQSSCEPGTTSAAVACLCPVSADGAGVVAAGLGAAGLGAAGLAF